MRNVLECMCVCALPTADLTRVRVHGSACEMGKAGGDTSANVYVQFHLSQYSNYWHCPSHTANCRHSTTVLTIVPSPSYNLPHEVHVSETTLQEDCLIPMLSFGQGLISS